MNVFVPGNTSELRPKMSYIAVVLQDRSGKDIALKPHTEISTVTATNKVPSTQVSTGFDLDERQRVPCILDQVESTDIPGRSHQGSSNPRNILQKLDLSRIEEWEAQL